MSFLSSLVLFSFIIFHHVNLEKDAPGKLDSDSVISKNGLGPPAHQQPQQEQHLQQQQQQQQRQRVSSTRVTHTNAKSSNSKGHAKAKLVAPHVPSASSKSDVTTNQKKEKLDSVDSDPKLSQAGVPGPEAQRVKAGKGDDKISVASSGENNEAKVSNLEIPNPVNNQDHGDAGHTEESKLSEEAKTDEEATVKESNVVQELPKTQNIPPDPPKNQENAAEDGETKKKAVEDSQKLQQDSVPEKRTEEYHNAAITERNLLQVDETEQKEQSQSHSVDEASPEEKDRNSAVESATSAEQVTGHVTTSPDDFKILDLNVDPNQQAETIVSAGRVIDGAGKPTEAPALESAPDNAEASKEANESDAAIETLPNDSSTASTTTNLSDKNINQSVSDDTQPISSQPPQPEAEKFGERIPGTANVPGEVKNEDEPKSEDEMEEQIAMPSFREWKEKETEKSRQMGAEQSIQASAPLIKAKGTKKRANYASVTCGAKIVGVNPEAQNPSFILMENKDQYMINPCKARKVFTVELCEPIQVQAIDIGNLELFSSLPQSFDVHVSDRFPTKEWKALGRFHARDERAVQTFQVDDTLLFAKYIRIEMLSHYGSEHYCPLSILRVFGITLDEDDDVDEGENESLDVLDEEAALDTFAQDNPTNLFASATDTVLSLVKTVLNPSADTAQKDDENVGSLASGNSNKSAAASSNEDKKMEPCVPTAMSGSPESGAVGDESEQGSQFQPLMPEATIGIVGHRPSEHQSVDSSEVFPQHEPFKITPIESPQAPLDTILGACEFCDDGTNNSCLFDRRTTCGYYRMMSFIDPKSCTTAWNNIQASARVYGTKEPANTAWMPEPEAAKSKYLEPEIGSQENIKQEESAKTQTPGKTDGSETEIAGSSDAGEAPVKSSNVGDDSRTEVTEADENLKHLQDAKDARGDGESPSGTAAGSVPVTASKDYHSADSGRSSDVECKSAAENAGQFGGDNVGQGKSQGQTVEDASQERAGVDAQSRSADQKSAHEAGKSLADKDSVPNGPVTGAGSEATQGSGATQGSRAAPGVGVTPAVTQGSGSSQDPGTVQSPGSAQGTGSGQSPGSAQGSGSAQSPGSAQGSGSTQTPGSPQGSGSVQGSGTTQGPGAVQNSGASTMKVIYAEAASKADNLKDYELDGIPMDEITFQKLSPRGKESAFIKLKNRIKLLEVNLNLTNRYLEELSQRYKRQMEEMHSSLNKTITKLSNMAKTAEERDVKQQEHIADLETSVGNLTSVVSSVKNSLDSMQQQMIERHLYLMILEILIFSGLMIYCLNQKNTHSFDRDTRHSNSSRVEVGNLPRANGCATSCRNSPETDLPRDGVINASRENGRYNPCSAVEDVKSHPPSAAVNAVTTNATTVAGAYDFSRKRKKKKLSHIRSLSPSSVRPINTYLASLPSHSPATGLIFGTCKDRVSNESLKALGDNNPRSHRKRFSWDSSSYKPWKWNIFGSSQDQKTSCVSTGTAPKPGRSETRENNIANEFLDGGKNGLSKTSGIVDYRLNQKNSENCLLISDIHAQNKFMMKKVASRGRPVAE